MRKEWGVVLFAKKAATICMNSFLAAPFFNANLEL
jgi:hypothetical protein